MIGDLCGLGGLLLEKGLYKHIFGALKNCSNSSQGTSPVGSNEMCAHAPWPSCGPWVCNLPSA